MFSRKRLRLLFMDSFSSEKRNLDVEYTWADDLWGSFDARTGQWNGVVRQVNLNPQIICHHLSSKISWHCPFNYILWQVGTKMTDLGVSFISYTAERYAKISVVSETQHRSSSVLLFNHLSWMNKKVISAHMENTPKGEKALKLSTSCLIFAHWEKNFESLFLF